VDISELSLGDGYRSVGPNCYPDHPVLKSDVIDLALYVRVLYTQVCECSDQLAGLNCQINEKIGDFPVTFCEDQLSQFVDVKYTPPLGCYVFSQC
jgi:hypothetical protein